MTVADTVSGGASASSPASIAVRTLPTLVVVGVVAALGWHERGSTLPAHWLGWATLAAAILAVAAAADAAHRPPRAPAFAAVALAALALWWAISISWSPLPTFARDEALLTAFYAVALAVPLVTLRAPAERRFAVGAVGLAVGGLALATALQLVLSDAPETLFVHGRLHAPVSYANGAAALFVLGVWPGLALAAHRPSPVLVRAVALALAVACLGAWLMTQSKGGAVALLAGAAAWLALSPGRLRLAVPLVAAAGLTAAGFDGLTETFRAESEARREPARAAGWTLLLISAGGLFAGALVAAVDRRLELPARLRAAAGRAALALCAVAVVAAVVAARTAVEDPRAYLADRWAEFKVSPRREEGPTHFSTLGSNRYDFWRVALDEFRERPLEGVGARGFGAIYLQERRSREQPAHSHSVVMDTLMEGGVVGTALLAAALLPLLWFCARRSRELAAGVGLAAGTSFVAHAAVDWTWSIPAVGAAGFVLLGIGAAEETRPLRPRARRAVALAAILAALVFLPTWLAARLTLEAYFRPVPPSQLSWAKQLDPLSVGPYLAEGQRAASAEEAVRAFSRAVEKEPQNVTAMYALGMAYLAAGDRPRARLALEQARALSPHDPVIQAAIERAAGE